ncbi:MAG: pyridoxamine 5'-phosphate oxidase family protein [Candidatus Omnitrophica bacterium]|nr:pyridoxamine 5'-phosphate oxidase family protein [Candidatus Omnitrophota bacterium]MBU1869256.1 pyridoxamine 5'-phosphate oxidase family protein [Candidatus Omnitrophota bacterium]
MITKKILEFLREREFISTGTCDIYGRPNAAPKFILKAENNCIYLVDYIVGRTCDNIRENPRASLSFINTDTLIGYQINGRVEMIENGQEYQSIIDELDAKQIDLSAKRIIEGVTKGKSHAGFEVGLSEKFVVLKVIIEDVVEINPHGVLNRERL